MKNKLGVKYEVKTMKKVNNMLGIKIEKIEEGIRILQKTYTV